MRRIANTVTNKFDHSVLAKVEHRMFKMNTKGIKIDRLSIGALLNLAESTFVIRYYLQQSKASILLHISADC